MINGIGISLKAGGSRPTAIRTCSNNRKADRDRNPCHEY
jgi:hypothetical protein